MPGGWGAAMIGTSDQPCWLAEACKGLLLLLAGPGCIAGFSIIRHENPNSLPEESAQGHD